MNWTGMLISFCEVGMIRRRLGMGLISAVSPLLDIFGLGKMRRRL